MDSISSNESSNDLDMDNDSIQGMEHQHKEEEKYFCKLYNEVLDCMLFTQHISEEEVSEGVERVIAGFRYDQGGRFSDINLREPATLCGYLFRFGSHGAGLARCRVLEALQNCAELRSCLETSVLKIVSLGGGPGNDAIGFCSALSDSQFSGRLVINVIDSIGEWSKCIELSNTLLPIKNFGNVSQMFFEGRVAVNFIQAILPGNPFDDPCCFGEIEDAHIILITKLISILDWEKKKELFKTLYELMKPTSFILLIDSPFWEEEVRDWFNVLYVSDAQNTYQSTVIKQRFGRSICTQSKARIAVLTKKTNL